MAGYGATQFWPARGNAIWVAIIAIGIAAMTAMGWRRARAGKMAPEGKRIALAVAAIFAYGLLWSLELSRLGGRELGAFWATLAMLGYVLAGIWLGRFIALVGIAVTVLTVIGYLFLGAWFD